MVLFRLCVIGCVLMSSTGFASAMPPEAVRTHRIVTFGTSLTSNGGWQKPLASALEACTQQAWSVDNYGKAGSTSDWGAEAVKQIAIGRSDIVLVEFAVNDAAIDSWIGLSASVENMTRIVKFFQGQQPDVAIYIMSMNPLSGYRFWARPFRDSYETAHWTLATDLGLGYIDHRPDWNAMGSEALRREIADGAHPTGESASAIIVPNVMKQLQRDGRIECSQGD